MNEELERLGSHAGAFFGYVFCETPSPDSVLPVAGDFGTCSVPGSKCLASDTARLTSSVPGKFINSNDIEKFEERTQGISAKRTRIRRVPANGYRY